VKIELTKAEQLLMSKAIADRTKYAAEADAHFKVGIRIVETAVEAIFESRQLPTPKEVNMEGDKACEALSWPEPKPVVEPINS